MRPLPLPAALAVVVLGGVASAAQGVVNAELGERTGDPVLGAVVDNLGGCLIVLAGLAVVPAMRAGLAGLRRALLAVLVAGGRRRVPARVAVDREREPDGRLVG
ncbi:DMT family transporter [Micromonospora sp. NPDC050980]|uniref:DMT family transporter n=1 Tax=Micromonospora sp. NPDC050980 TaxID=3155161 RepID=UPI0033CF0A5E